MTSLFAGIDEALARLKSGGMILLLDDENRENEGDLVIAAEFADADAVNFMTRYGRGLICLSMSNEYIDRLHLPMMVEHNRSPYKTAFTVSIEAAAGVSTGISAHDRARTIAVAIDENTKPQDLVSPGHIFPLRARAHGVLERPGQTEGSVDLVRLAGLKQAAVICEVMNEDGTMSRRDELAVFSKRHNIPMVNIAELIDYRIQHEMLMEVSATATIPTHDYGNFDMHVFQGILDKKEHFALVKPSINKSKAPLVRVHSECITGDLFGSCKCDCGHQLEHSLKLLSEEGGILIYLRQEGRGIGLANKLKAYALQEQGLDTVEANEKLGFPADSRSYATAFQMLKFFGVEAVRLLTNNPRKVRALEKYGMNVNERIPLTMEPTHVNRGYLKTKQIKLGHLLTID